MNFYSSLQSGLVRVIPVILLFTMSACDKQSAGNAAAPHAMPPPAVTITNPVSKEVTDWDEFTGRLYPVESVDVRARVSGYLDSVNFTEGAIVKKGDLLYVIDPRPYKIALDEALAEKNRADAALDLAENDLKRAQNLHKAHAMSDEELDTRGKQKREAQAQLDAAKAAIAAAKLNIEFTHITAPISGRISRTSVTVGNLVKGGDMESTLLTNIVSLDPIYVYFTADEQSVLRYTRLDMQGSRESSRIKPNPVFLKLADEDDFVHKGHMDFVDNQIDLNTGTMRARAIVENPDLLLVPGMFADVKLLGEGPYQSLLIPDKAINVDQTTRFVYVVDDKNMVSRREVTPGRMFEGLRVIRSGLNPDDKVVIDGLQRIRAGMQVTPQTQDAETKAQG